MEFKAGKIYASKITKGGLARTVKATSKKGVQSVYMIINDKPDGSVKIKTSEGILNFKTHKDWLDFMYTATARQLTLTNLMQAKTAKHKELTCAEAYRLLE